MFKAGLAASVTLLVIGVLVLWLVGMAFGFNISVVGSLAASLVLTLLLNLVVTAISRRRNRGY